MNDNRERGKPGTAALLQALLGAGRAIEARLEAAIEPHGLSLAKMGVLENLVQAGEPLPLGVLSERLGCVKSNVTQLVDRLEADRLVRRVPDPRDRRSVQAALTEEGERRYRAARQALAEAEAAMVGPLSASEREQLASLLGRFRAGRAQS